MDTSLFIRLYGYFLSLLPPRFRDEFGEEMQQVFSQVLDEAQASGVRTLWILTLRELFDLPQLALREYWRERKLPPYLPTNGPLPMAPPVPRWALWASLGLFVIPAVLIVFGRYLPPVVSSVLAALFGVLLISAAIAGLAKGLPPWSLPFLGVAISFIGIYAIQPALENALTPVWAPIYKSLTHNSALLPRLLWQFIRSGQSALSILLVLVGTLLVLRSFPPTRAFFDRLSQDRTQISFLLYGVVPLILFISLDEYRYDEPLMAAMLLVLAAGTWAFLHSRYPAMRILSLLVAVSLAFTIMGLAKFFLIPVQDWNVWFKGYPPETERYFESLREIATWFWMVAMLLFPIIVRRRPGQFTANILLFGLWLFLFRPVYPYLGTIFTRQEFRLNQFALAGVIGLLIYQVRKNGLGLHIGAAPALHPTALAMLLGSSGAFILAERLVDINTLSASLFGLAFYGLLGLWLEPRRWRQGLPAALLLIGTLPFGEHLQTFVGYPVRLLTARLVQDGLGAFDIHTVGIDTILVFESGISQIDLPCSGVKSLWTGGMFLLAATWIEQRKITRRWLLAALVFAFLLFTANLARVAILVTVGPALGWNLLAEMLHVPLGVLGFAAACAALVWMLRRFVPAEEKDEPIVAGTIEVRVLRPRWLLPVLITTILFLTGLYTPRPEAAAAQTESKLHFPPGLSVEPWPFSPDELEWLSADGPLSANRWRFTWERQGETPRQGSVLMISSDTWRAHHRPERCFEAYGLTVDQSYSTLLDENFPLRVLYLNAGRQRYHYSAVYWLQAPGRVTDDYATRIWSDLNPQRQTWVLVTVLFDTALDPTRSDLKELYTGLRQSVAQTLEGGYQP